MCPHFKCLSSGQNKWRELNNRVTERGKSMSRGSNENRGAQVLNKLCALFIVVCLFLSSYENERLFHVSWFWFVYVTY